MKVICYILAGPRPYSIDTVFDPILSGNNEALEDSLDGINDFKILNMPETKKIVETLFRRI